MTVIRKTGLAAVLLLCLCLAAGPASAARIYVDVNQPFAQKIPVAVPDFLPIVAGESGPSPVTLGLPMRLADNLDLTGLFINLDKRTFLESNTRSGLADEPPVQYKEWRAIGGELLVKGSFALTGDQLTLEMRLFDVIEGRMILGKRYTGNVKDGRSMVNRFTNEILLLITGEPGVFGSQIVFVSGTRANKQVMLAEFGNDEVKAVTRGPGPWSMPAISKDGRLAYVHRSNGKYELWVDGQVISSGPLHISPAFTPGGEVLAAVSGKRDTNIFRFPGGGQKSVQVTNNWGINISPTLSPDGGRMAYVSDRSGTPQVYVSSAGGGPSARVTTETKESTDPNWSPRGDRITYVGDSRDVYIVAPDGSGNQQLTAGTGVNTRPSWSPDGRLIVFASTRNGRSQLFVMSANGERQRPLIPEYKGDQRQPQWSQGQPGEQGQ